MVAVAGTGVGLGGIVVPVGGTDVPLGRAGASVAGPGDAGNGVALGAMAVWVGARVSAGKVAGSTVKVAVNRGRSVLTGEGLARDSSPEPEAQPIRSRNGRNVGISHLHPKDHADARTGWFAWMPWVTDSTLSSLTTMGF
jgi:hypothetical protein